MAKQVGVDPLLALTVADEMSGFNPNSMKFNPSKLNPNLDPTEGVLMASQLGIMMVPGSIARELGLKGSLVELFQPDMGARYGCLWLAKLSAPNIRPDEILAMYQNFAPLHLGY